MKNQIIIHAAGKQTRIALLENGELAQLFIESPENQRTVGDIYVAEVRKVMAGIRAAFIDMNTPKDAFLHFSDLGEHLDDYLVMLNGKEVLGKDGANRLQALRSDKDPNHTNKSGTNTEEQNILGNMLKPGQKVLVQIVKEPIGSKGPRVSTNISIAGRFIVLIPMGDYVAVSKRIKSYKERRVLRQTVADILPDGFGVIVRTVAEGQDSKLIEEDLKDVLEKWNNIVKDIYTAKPPTLLHRDLEMTESLVRDLFAKDFDRILVDDPKMHKSLRTYVSKIAPTLLPNIELYKGNEHIFDHMHIMQDVESVFSPRVKMPSGGYLIFEQTEAMYVVDVNSGRYAAKKAQEDNSLKTNLEAAREIAKQLRLRDIGGIIVVDFIDLRDDVNRKKVYDELKKEFRKDRAKTNLLAMSDFGLIEITRQRIRPSVVKSVSHVCPMCGGGGSIVSQNTILSDIEGWLQKFKNGTKYRAVDLHINPYMKGMLTKGWISQHFKWMLKYRLGIGIIEDLTLSMNDYKFTLSDSDVDITETIIMDQSIEQAVKAAELRIAALESELKRDDSTLDIFRKEPLSRGNGRSSDSRDDRSRDDRSYGSENGRSDNRLDRNDRNQRPDDRKDTGKDQRSTQTTPTAPQKSKVVTKEQPTPEKTAPATAKEKSGTNQNDPRRNQKNSKYYKKSDQADENEIDDTTEETKQQPAKAQVQGDQKPSKPNENQHDSKDQPKKEHVESERKDEDHIPEELSHLRSALEVAREYKLKREKELADGTTSNGEKTINGTSKDGTANNKSTKKTESSSNSQKADKEDNSVKSKSSAKAKKTTSTDKANTTTSTDKANKTNSEQNSDDEKVSPATTSQLIQAVVNAKKIPAKSISKPANKSKTEVVKKETKPAKTTSKKKTTPKQSTKTPKKRGDDMIDDSESSRDDRPVKGE